MICEIDSFMISFGETNYLAKLGNDNEKTLTYSFCILNCNHLDTLRILR
jgi:hypothetical protein